MNYLLEIFNFILISCVSKHVFKKCLTTETTQDPDDAFVPKFGKPLHSAGGKNAFSEQNLKLSQQFQFF